MVLAALDHAAPLGTMRIRRTWTARESGFRLLLIACILSFLVSVPAAGSDDIAVVVDSGSNRVFLVDPQVGAVIRQIPVGNRRIAYLALSGDGRTAFVTSGEAQSVYAVDVQSGAVRRNQIGGGPVGVALSPAGEELYVAQIDAASIAVVDSRTLAVLRTVPVAREPILLAVSADGQTLYVAHFNRPLISVVDIPSGTVAGRVDLGVAPYRLTFGRYSGFVYFSFGLSEKNLAVLDPVTLQSTFITVPGLTNEIADSPLGFLIVTTNFALAGPGGVFLDAASLTPTSVFRTAGDVVDGVAFNAATDRAYVTSWYRGLDPENGNGGVLSVLDVAQRSVSSTIRRVGRAPQAVAISNIELPCGNGALDAGEDCDDGNRRGGDGCALNCTREVERVFDVRPDESHLTLSTRQRDYSAGVRGSMVLRSGRAGVDGSLPMTVLAADVAFDPIPLQGAGCVCLRAAVPPEAAGRRQASGDVACGDGEVFNITYYSTRDHDRRPSDPDCIGGTREGPADPHPGACNGPDKFQFGFFDSRGAGVIEAPLRFDLIADGGTCAVDPLDPRKGADGRPCTDDDPGAAQAVALHPFTTGTALAGVGVADLDPAADIGLFLTGTRFDCVALAETTAGGIGGVRLVSALPLLHLAPLGDAVLTLDLQAHSDEPPTPTPSPTPFPTPSGPAFFVADVFPGPAPGLRDGMASSSTLVIGDLLYLPMRDAAGGFIWRTDGTEAGTVPLQADAERPNLHGTSLNALGASFLVAVRDALHGVELWRVDRASGETALVADIRPGERDSNPGVIGTHGGVAYLVADDGVHGRELWRTDGTAAGTWLVADIAPGAAGNGIGELVWLDDVALFTADDGTHGSELWRTDGTAGGTALVADLAVGARSASPLHLTRFGARVFFTTNDGDLWASDGTAAGTTRVSTMGFGYAAVLDHWLLFETAVYSTSDNTSHRELWRTDGTPAGTVRVTERELSADGLGFYGFTVYNGSVYFSANDGVHGREIWKSDGTDAGTMLLKDIYPGPAGEQVSTVEAAAGWLFIVANDGQTGREPWISDGSEAGTHLLQDIAPGPIESMSGGFFVQAGPFVFFPADDRVRDAGTELWAVRVADLGTPPSPPPTATPTPTPSPRPPCAGDCDGDATVSIDELLRAVGIALETAPLSRCTAADANADGAVTMNELVTAVRHALGGCTGSRAH